MTDEERKLFQELDYHGKPVFAARDDSTGEWWYYLNSIADIAGRSTAILTQQECKMIPWKYFTERAYCFVLNFQGALKWVMTSDLSTDERKDFAKWLKGRKDDEQLRDV